jgi:hypothetical protein
MNPWSELPFAQRPFVLRHLASALHSSPGEIDLPAKPPNGLRVLALWTLLAIAFWTERYDFLAALLRCRAAPVCGCAPRCCVHSAGAGPRRRGGPSKVRWQWPVSWRPHRAFLRECGASLRARIRRPASLEICLLLRRALLDQGRESLKRSSAGFRFVPAIHGRAPR